MNDVVIGLLGVAVGIYLCLRGHWALRILLAIWGAFLGLSVGGAIVDRITGDGFLSTLLGWVVGIVLALLFAAIAYLYYAVSIFLAMISMGFVLGGTLASALGAEQTWVITLVGLAVGLLLAILTIIADLPAMLLVLLSAATGASMVLGGLMLIFGQATLQEISHGRLDANDHVGWFIAWPVLFVVGVVAQLVNLEQVRGQAIRDADALARPGNPSAR